MHRNPDNNWTWAETAMEPDDSSTAIRSDDRFSRAQSASGSTLTGCSNIALSLAISATSSQERRDSVFSDVSSLSKSSVMGIDDLFDDPKRPHLLRWHSNDMLFDQSMFPACPVRRSSIAKNERPTPARWSSGQVLPMRPPKPVTRKSSLVGDDSPESPPSKLPTTNAKKIPSRRQKVKRAPSRIKSHGSLRPGKTPSTSSVSRKMCRGKSERWALTEGLNASSQHLPTKPTRRSSVVQGQDPITNGRESVAPVPTSPASFAAVSVDTSIELSSPATFAASVEEPNKAERIALAAAGDHPVSKPVKRSHSDYRRNKRNDSKPAKSKSEGEIPSRHNEPISQGRDRRSMFGEKRPSSGRSILPGDGASDCGSIVSKLSGSISIGGFRIPLETCSNASASVGSGLSAASSGINVSDAITPALGKGVKQIRRWANSA